MNSHHSKTQKPLPKSWKEVFFKEFQESYFQDLKTFLEKQIKKKEIFYPEPTHIFRSFDLCPQNKLKVVIIGQDPYHGQGQAHGLSFSVPRGIKIPPSLKNIYKEIQQDLNISIPNHGNLESWATQGVLLLNATLTVSKGKPASHSKKGWETFTDHIIDHINKTQTGIVFMLWGRYAQEKGKQIDESQHLVLKAPHPSPFSAHSGFFGCKHFSKTNTYLKENQKQEIDWEITT